MPIPQARTDPAWPPHAAAEARPASLWRNRSFLLILTGYALSTFGSCFHSVAIGLWMLRETGSAKSMSAVSITYIAIGVLFGAFAGTTADRANRKRLMWTADLASAALVAGIAVCVAVPGAPLAAIFVLTAGVAFAGLFQSPALQASVGDLVGPAAVPRAVGAMQIAENAARISGLAAGGAFVALFGGAAAIAVDAGTFLLSGLLVLACAPFGRPRSAVAVDAEAAKRKSFLQDLAEGLRFVWRDRLTRAVVLLTPALGMFFLSGLLLIQVMAVRSWRASPTAFGLLEACIPAGYLIGASLLMLLDKRLTRRGYVICLGLLALGPAQIAVALQATAWSALPLVLLLGALFSFCTVLLSVALRQHVDSALQGRVFAVIGSLSGIMPPLGLAIAGFAADHGGPKLPLLVAGLLLTLFAAVSVALQKTLRGFR